MTTYKPDNWKKLNQNLWLTIHPLDLDELEEAIQAPGCHPDAWTPEPDTTPLHYLVKNTIPSKSMMVDDDDATEACKKLIDAGANVLHKSYSLLGQNRTVLQSAEYYLEDKKHRYPKLFELLRNADSKAISNDAGYTNN